MIWVHLVDNGTSLQCARYHEVVVSTLSIAEHLGRMAGGAFYIIIDSHTPNYNGPWDSPPDCLLERIT